MKISQRKGRLCAALSVLLALCMLAGPTSAGFFTGVVQAADSGARTVFGRKVDVARPGKGTDAGVTRPGYGVSYAPDETVTVIVVLEAPSAAECYDAEDEEETGSAGERLSSYLSSDMAQTISAQNMTQQNALADTIDTLAKDADACGGIATVANLPPEVEVVANFTGVINAMSVKMPYGLLETVKNLSGVRTAYVERTYSVPSDEEIEPLEGGIEKYGYAQAGVNGLWEAGYTGQGMVVAVLDTSLDIEYGSWWDYGANANVTGVRGCHEAFRDDSFMSDNPYSFVAYTPKSMEKMLAVNSDDLIAGFVGKDAYKTLKVPFAVDYSHMESDGRIDNNVSSEETHGTHVSGTILGYAEKADGAVKFSGIAPDAQLLFMKVFEDDGSMTSTTPLLAALNDAAYLGADVVNLSLGSDNGFVYEDDAQEIFFEMLEEFGVIASVSNGNSGSSQELNSGSDGMAYTENPDTTMTSSPAIYSSVLGVASVNTTVYSVKYLEWSDGDKTYRIQYIDSGTDPNKRLFGEVISGRLDENNGIYDCGFGTREDYEKVEWQRTVHNPPNYEAETVGKYTGFALVKRGGEGNLSFTDKVNNAMRGFSEYDDMTGTVKGIRGIIVYNNEDGMIGMDLTGCYNDNLPAISISQADGEAIKAAIEAGKPVTLKLVDPADYAAEWPVEPDDIDQPGEMSSFTSWGGGPGLELKPDITAPGGMVYSSIPDSSYDKTYKVGAYTDYNGTYEYMSGTSMAAPHIAGIAALVSQALSDSSEPFYQNRSAEERAAFVEHLLVSTASPLADAVTDAFVSPRRQGAGVVNGGAAINTPVFACVDGANVGKLELLDDAAWSGSFDFTVSLKNTTPRPHTYTAELVVMTPEVTKASNGKTAYTSHDVVLDRVDLGRIEVAGGIDEDTELSGKIRYDADKIKAASPNGTYIEGYIILTPVGEDIATLSVPFLGFAGDWTAAPIFDNLQWWELTDEDGELNEKIADTVFSSEEYGLYYGQMGYINEFDSYPTMLGMNPFDNGLSQIMNYGPYGMGNFTISPNGDGHIDSINYFELYQLRDARIMMFEVADKDTGDIYYRTYIPCFPRTSFMYYETANTYIPFPSSLQLTSWGFEYAGDYVDDITGELEALPSGTQLEFRIGAFGEGDYEYAVDEEIGLPVADVNDVYVCDPDTWPTFNGHPMDMTGDIIKFDVLIDNDAPTLVGRAASVTKQADGTILFEGTFDDGVGSIASVEVYPYVRMTIKEEYRETAESMGLDEEIYRMDTYQPFEQDLIFDEDAHTYKFSYKLPDPNEKYVHTPINSVDALYDYSWDGTVYLFCGDYGANDAAYVFSINDESSKDGELSAVWNYGDLYVGDEAPVTVVDNTGAEGSVTYSSSDGDVATVDEDGVITAVGPGTAIITLTKAGETVKIVITVREKPEEIADFSFSLNDVGVLRPGDSVEIRAEDIVPFDFNGEGGLELEESEWTVHDPNWEFYDDGGDPFTVTVNDIPGRAYYQKAATVTFKAGYGEYYEPGTEGVAILTVTLNGCTKTAKIHYEIPNDGEDYLMSADYSLTMTKYMYVGDTAELAAQYSRPELHQPPKALIDIKVCAASGYKFDNSSWEDKGTTYDLSEGLYIVPEKGEEGSKFVGYILARPGFTLPAEEDIHVGIHRPDGNSKYTPLINGSYAQWTFDSTTGMLTVNNLPEAGAELVIHADGVADPNSKGTSLPDGYTPPTYDDGSDIESLYGPFTWSAVDASGEDASDRVTVTAIEGDSKNSVAFKATEPGTYYVTATNKAGDEEVTWAIVVYPIPTDSGVELIPVIDGDAETIEGVKYSLVLGEHDGEYQLEVEAFDEDGEPTDLPGDLIWESSDGSIVTVDGDGVVTVNGVGIVTVTVRSKSNPDVSAHFIIEVVAHDHDYTLKHDTENHWYECSDENCPERIKDKAAHTWDAGKVTKAATCADDGVKTFTCTVCGETKTEAVKATGEHTWDAGKVTKAPTCADDGVKTFTCTVCGETKTEAVKATGEHVYENGKCKVCGAAQPATDTPTPPQTGDPVTGGAALLAAAILSAVAVAALGFTDTKKRH